MTFGTYARGAGTFLCALAVLSACKKAGDPAPAPAPAPTTTEAPKPPPPAVAPAPVDEPGTWYHAKLVYDGTGELPFFIHIPPQGTNGRAIVQNGTETAEFKASWRDNEVDVDSPWNYTSEIEADLDPKTHKLEGTWTRDTPLWGQVVRKFIAEPIDKPDPKTRFPDVGGPAGPSIAGTWKFDFKEHHEGKGQFEQDPDGVIRGYVRPGQLGDIRFLAGNLHGTALSLSTFNGNAANLVLAKVSPDGKTMTGLMSMQNVWNEKFTATKVDDFVFPNKVHLKDGKTTVTLKGLEKYRGKPTFAMIFATWCSSCNDAHPYFVDLYKKFHSQGLEIYAVAYDLSDDVKENDKQIDIFRKKYDIPWELAQVPCTPETWAKAMPPELEGWDGLPINLLIRPDGTVQTVQGGWFGPATGAEGEKLRSWFTDQVKQLVDQAKQHT
jgi:thiol-disulfide isomerase/thioredoxin